MLLSILHVSFCGTPVVLYLCRLISDDCQVHLCLLPVRQTKQLLDHIVGHLLHELQRLHVVAPRSEDLVQPCEVLVQAALHAAHGAGHLEGTREEEEEEGGEMNDLTVLQLGALNKAFESQHQFRIFLRFYAMLAAWVKVTASD